MTCQDITHLESVLYVTLSCTQEEYTKVFVLSDTIFVCYIYTNINWRRQKPWFMVLVFNHSLP